MTQPSPLATPEPWNLVSAAYAEEVMPMFTGFAEAALQLADVTKGERVLDIACGPGTLALLAARRGARVDALDFSPAMVELLRAAVTRESLHEVTAQVGDGQSLPFGDGSYDSAFSMFGLMFFPDRARGFAELRRCLKTGGVAVVSSWHPMEASVPFCAALFSALREHVPGLPFGGVEPPLGAPRAFDEEMGAAGFRDIEVHEVRHEDSFPTLDEGWRSLQRTMAPLAMLAHKMGAGWAPVADRMYGSLREQFGEGPQTITMPAWLGVGRA